MQFSFITRSHFRLCVPCGKQKRKTTPNCNMPLGPQIISNDSAQSLRVFGSLASNIKSSTTQTAWSIEPSLPTGQIKVRNGVRWETSSSGVSGTIFLVLVFFRLNTIGCPSDGKCSIMKLRNASSNISPGNSHQEDACLRTSSATV